MKVPQILLIADAGDPAGAPQVRPDGKPMSKEPTKADLAAEIERLAAENAALKAAKAKDDAEEKLIAEKVAAGLSRQQAINVIQRNRYVGIPLQIETLKRRNARVAKLVSKDDPEIADNLKQIAALEAQLPKK